MRRLKPFLKRRKSRVRRQSPQTCSPTNAVAIYLPTEMIQEILGFIPPRFSYEDYPEFQWWPTYAPLQVSKQWRAAALTMSSLWTKITIDGDMIYRVTTGRRMTNWIERSGALGITLRLRIFALSEPGEDDYDDAVLRSNVRILESCVERWISLAVITVLPTHTHKLLELLPRASKLQSLQLDLVSMRIYENWLNRPFNHSLKLQSQPVPASCTLQALTICSDRKPEVFPEMVSKPRVAQLIIGEHITQLQLVKFRTTHRNFLFICAKFRNLEQLGIANVRFYDESTIHASASLDAMCKVVFPKLRCLVMEPMVSFPLHETFRTAPIETVVLYMDGRSTGRMMGFLDFLDACPTTLRTLDIRCIKGHSTIGYGTINDTMASFKALCKVTIVEIRDYRGDTELRLAETQPDSRAGLNVDASNYPSFNTEKSTRRGQKASSGTDVTAFIQGLLARTRMAAADVKMESCHLEIDPACYLNTHALGIEDDGELGTYWDSGNLNFEAQTQPRWCPVYLAMAYDDF